MTANELGMQSAYPGQACSQSGDPCAAYEYGLTKRELFAAMAMQGLLASDPAYDGSDPHGVIAIGAVACADALLAELAREPQP
jgi:hypothetical protein